MISKKIKNLNKYSKDDIFDMTMTVGDIQGLVASGAAGCRAHLPDIIAEVVHLRDIIKKLNRVSKEAGEEPFCPEIETSSTAKVVTAVMLYGRGVRNKADLSWLNEIDELND